MYTDEFSDTIIALSTSQGVGAIGVIRLSGSKSVEIVNSLFSGKNLAKQASHTIHLGKFVYHDQVLDEVLVSLFIAPSSYTKENVVEISCHGSPFIQQKILEALIDSGARAAKAGEFTMRAFLNGRFDLSQAEAVADLIASDSEASHKSALQQMKGGFSLEIKKLREDLIHFASLVELELDFAEEDVEFADRSKLKTLIDEIVMVMEKLIHSFKLGNVIKNGVNVVIAGKPNAGKSTLLNALLNEERAIVSEIPGTTRDTIEETLNINGILFRFIDTAGIRESVDVIESLGIEKTMQKIETASVVLYIFDVTTTTAEDLRMESETLSKNIPLLLIGNKSDKASLTELENKFYGFENMIFISAKQLTNVDQIKDKLSDIVLDKSVNVESNIVTNIRHYEALNACRGALQNVLSALDSKTTTDFLAQDIRYALNALGEITGDITTDDLLDNIFSKFCIGK
ncbi:MAG: tRNA modification GTPase trmE [Bacteroidota bacterium]|nr:tRNA modification GTPase trmE [Bacteroidota bacterium]